MQLKGISAASCRNNSVAGRVTPGTSPLIPEDVQKEIVQSIEVKSAALQLMPHVTMKRAQQRIPVMTQLPIAYWLTGACLDARDRGLKQTTSLAWDNVYLNAEEMAVIVPMAKTLLDDIDYDFWSQVKPKVTEAFGVALDEAIFFGNGAPSPSRRRSSPLPQPQATCWSPAPRLARTSWATCRRDGPGGSRRLRRQRLLGAQAGQGQNARDEDHHRAASSCWATTTARRQR